MNDVKQSDFKWYGLTAFFNGWWLSLGVAFLFYGEIQYSVICSLVGLAHGLINYKLIKRINLFFQEGTKR